MIPVSPLAFHPERTKDRPRLHVVLINPPALKGRTNERTLSGGIGVSRKLKPWQRDRPRF